MRPVVLEMNGFATFREPTVVDFSGVEYFALVGPTGSGKSTVIDAMTFALYGSVPRWDDRRAVALALAPTVGRGTVRLVFDVGGRRYVVARELRRAASGGVSVRTARLERLLDPAGLGLPEEETEPVADGAGAVSRAVEELLGLPFGDFCTCVVLPQGDFAEFLHIEPRLRQEKLVRLLGLGVYDVIARAANAEAASRRLRAEVLTGELAGYADATQEAERAAAARLAELDGLAARVQVALPRWATAAAAVEDARALVDRLRSERTALAGLTPPPSLDELGDRERGTQRAAVAAGVRAAAAEAADTAARERLTAAPTRAPLEQARRDHAELGRLAAELPGAREQHDLARAAFDEAAHEAVELRATVEAARAGREDAAAVLMAAEDGARRLADERDGLRSLTVPTGLDELDRRRSAAATARERAESAVAAAEEADELSRAELAGAPARGPLEQARRDLRELASVRDEHRAAVARAAVADGAVAAAADRVSGTGERLARVRQRRTAAGYADLAAALRPALVEGGPCPVCAQVVATLPGGAAGGTDLPDAERAVDAAEQAHDEARRDQAGAGAARERVFGEVARLAATADRLRGALAAAPHDAPAAAAPDAAAVADATAAAAAVDAALAELDRLERAAVAAAAAVGGARRDRTAAAAEADAVHREVAAAATALRAARDPLVSWGAPAVDDADVPAGWTRLAEWARAEAGTREAALREAGAAAEAARRALTAADREWRAVEHAAEDLRRRETAAARAEQRARGTLDGVERRTAELRSALAGAPPDREAAAALEAIAGLESAARTADVELRAARAGQRSAERAALDVGREVAAAWEGLRAARDPLVPLGAPAVAGEDVRTAWRALAAWATGEAGTRQSRLVPAAATAATAAAAVDELERELTEDLSAHGVEAGTPLAATARAAVAAAAERARAALDRVVERRATASRIGSERDDAESAQQVAKMLGGLLRSDAFPRWLVASALDALVVDASRSLAELSGGQFELTHSGGEFLVIDHADADARRPVKTLSGGETFQASLALALALSDQMSGLAARGAARLESIFLDEGFGTLDEANLDVVASTLESLATRGDRMVGVITHVPALAERVPVRFAVRRDLRTSSVVREDAGG